MIDLYERLDECGAIHEDVHVVYTNDEHGDGYMKLTPVYADPFFLKELCLELVEPFKGQFDTIVAPAVGAIALSTTASQLISTPERPVSGIWAAKTAEKGFEIIDPAFVRAVRDQRVLIVEDSVKSGGSVVKVRKVVEALDGEVVGVRAVNTYGQVTAGTLEVPHFNSLIQVNFQVYDENDCVLCDEKVPIIEDIAHGSRFRTAQPDYPGGFARIFD